MEHMSPSRHTDHKANIDAMDSVKHTAVIFRVAESSHLKIAVVRVVEVGVSVQGRGSWCLMVWMEFEGTLGKA